MILSAKAMVIERKREASLNCQEFVILTAVVYEAPIIFERTSFVPIQETTIIVIK